MIDVRAEDDLFTELNEPKKKEEPKKDKISDAALMKQLGTFIRGYYNGMIEAGFSKKEAMELTKALISSTLLSSNIHDLTNKPIGGSRWTL